MKRTLTLLLFLIFASPVSLIYGQDSEPENEAPDTAQRRAEWFARQRGVEPGKLPSGLRAQGLRRLEVMRADEKNRKTAAASGALSLGVAAVNRLSSTPWKSIGPAVLTDRNGLNKFSGRISALAVDPRNSLVVYAGAADGGVWKTINGGQSWTPLTDAQPSLSIGSIALDPSAPDTVYVGTGELNGGDGYPGVGILKSTDAGNTWTNIQAPFIPKNNVGFRIAAVSVSPANSQIVLAAAASTSLPQGTEGVFRSADGGNTWTNVLRASLGATSVVFDPQNSSVAYAGIVKTNANGPQTVEVLKSTDAGGTWSGTGLAETAGSRVMLVVAPTDSSLYVAYTAVTSDRAFLFRSRDSGTSFTELNDSQLCTAQCGYNLAMAVNPTNSDEVFFGGFDILGSTDGGATWDFAFTTHADQHALAFSASGDRVYAGNDGGMWVATDLTRPLHLTVHHRPSRHFEAQPRHTGPRCAGRPTPGALATRATGGVLARIWPLCALVLPLALLPRGIRPTRVFGQRGPELVAHGH